MKELIFIFMSYLINGYFKQIQRWMIMFDLKEKYNLRENKKLMKQIPNKIYLFHYS